MRLAGKRVTLESGLFWLHSESLTRLRAESAEHDLLLSNQRRSTPGLFHGFHAGQHASHYRVLQFRRPLTACGITTAVDGVDGIPRGFESLAAQSGEPHLESKSCQ